MDSARPAAVAGAGEKLYDRATRLDTLHEVLTIARSKKSEYGPLTAAGCEAVASEIEDLIETENGKAKV